MNILVSDEDKDIRFLIRMYLRDYDIDFIEAKDGGECLELIRQRKPDLIVLNYMMDNLTGYQVAEEVYKDDSLRGTPIIMMTLEGFDLVKEKSGIVDYLAKPFTRSHFIEVVKSVVGEDVLKKRKKVQGSQLKPLKPAEKNIQSLKKTFGQKKILIADDEPYIIKLLKLILEKDYLLEVATTGEELVEKAGAEDYDLIISDVVMPKLSGWKSIKKIREAGNNVPVIFNSGLVKDMDLYETLRPAGPSRFILKPFKRDELLSAIKELLERP